MDELLKYLEERKTYLKKVEFEFFDAKYKFSNNQLRELCRNFSNEFWGRRNEVEQMIQFLNDQKRRNVMKPNEP